MTMPIDPEYERLWRVHLAGSAEIEQYMEAYKKYVELFSACCPCADGESSNCEDEDCSCHEASSDEKGECDFEKSPIKN